MRLVMMGTGGFALPTFQALYRTHHEVVALVTQPLRNERGATISPLRGIAKQQGAKIFDPDDVNAPESLERLAGFEADLFIVADYGQILSSAALATARLGGINLHGSLLPKYRGAAPINWALYHGEAKAGVSVIHMTPRIDAGPVLAQASLSVEPQENAPQLEARLSALGAPLACEIIDQLEQGPVPEIPQDASQRTKAPRLKKQDGAIDWTRPAEAIHNQVRALEPWPKTFTYWHRATGEPLRLIPGAVHLAVGSSAHPPGTVLVADGETLVLATGSGPLQIDSIQPAGKKMQSTAEFLRGYPVAVGDRFGGEAEG
jgi:methionyl-tRNA formyltransferase